jgi:hypothetical protein
MRRIFSVISLVVLGAWIANAQTNTRDVLNPPPRPYQQTSSTFCDSAGDCAILFPAIPNQLVLIRHTSCGFSLATSGIFFRASLGTQSFAGFNGLPAVANGTFSGVTNYTINAETYLFVYPHEQPRIDLVVFNASAGSFQCTISGHLFP